METSHQMSDFLNAIKDERNRHSNLRNAELLRKLGHYRNEFIHSRETGIDANLILPEEVWKMILEYVDEGNDLTNCARSCSLFYKILRDSGPCWMFGKVFRSLHHYLSREEILNCRCVCKQWQNGIDMELENAGTTVENTKQSSYSIDADTCLFERLPDYRNLEGAFDYGITLPAFGRSLDAQSVLNDGDIRREMKEHPRNPFIGRSIIVEANDYSSHPTFTAALYNFYNDFDDHIWHLSLKLDEMSLHQIYSILHKTLKYCTNLRSIKIRIDINSDDPDQRSIRLPPLPDHSNLESIDMITEGEHSTMFQQKVLDKYSRQLKQLCVELWHPNRYHHLEWGNLRILRVLAAISNQNLISLQQIKAPRLHKLHLELSGSRADFKLLMQAVNHFPKLETLVLDTLGAFHGFSSQDIASMPTELLCTTLLTKVDMSIELEGDTLEDISFDFLVCFPFLRELDILHTCRHDGSSDDESDSESVDEDKSRPSDVNQFRLINISQYAFRNDEYMDEVSRMYLSNVWEICPSLQKFYLAQNVKKSSSRCVYTRERYLREKMDKNILLKMQASLFEKEAVHQKYRRGVLLRNRFKELRMANKNPVCTDREGQVDIFERRIWKNILKFVTDANDLANCSSASSTFHEILKETKAEWAFPRIIGPLFCTLKKSEVLKCRTICKTWCTVVDGFLENYYLISEPVHAVECPFTGFRNGIYEYDYEFSFGVPKSKKFPEPYDRIRDAMKLHNRNPFVGRNVIMELNPIKGKGKQFEVNKDVVTFLKNFGSHIWGLKISGRKHDIRIAPGEYYRLLLTVLGHCKNLKNLTLFEIEIPWPKRFDYDNIRRLEIDSQSELMDHDNLESLTLKLHNDNLIPIQDALLNKYSAQLKRSDTCQYGEDLSSFNWDSLLELFISTQYTCDWIELLDNVEAPKLAFLSVRLDDVKLKELFRIINNFPHLQQVNLHFPNEFHGIAAEEMTNLRMGVNSPTSLLCLSLRHCCGNHVKSYSFLRFFQYVKKLVISYGCVHDSWHHRNGDFDNGRRDKSGDVTDSGNQTNKRVLRSSARANRDSDISNSNRELHHAQDNSHGEDISLDAVDETDIENEEEGDGESMPKMDFTGPPDDVVEDEAFAQCGTCFWDIASDQEKDLKKMYALGIWDALPSLEFLEFEMHSCNEETKIKVFSRQSYDVIKNGKI